MHDPLLENIARVTRRQFFGTSAMGIGTAALASLLGQGKASADSTKGLPGLPHFHTQSETRGNDVARWRPVTRRLVRRQADLAGNEGPGHSRLRPRDHPAFDDVQWLCQMALPTRPIKPHKQYGQSGVSLSEMLPNVGKIVDDICLIRSMNTEAVNHAPGVTFFQTGAQVPGRPSMGSWLSYGLGSDSENLPAFVVMTSSDRGKTCGQLFFDYYWGSGFLPSRFQGVRFRNSGDLVPYLANPPGVDRQANRLLLDDLAAMNAAHLADYGDPEIDTRISQYEMAFRMQSSVPDLVDFSGETKATIERYGPDVLEKGTYANNCLIARRLLERGVRFVQIMHAGWDQHSNLFTQLEKQCFDTEGPSAALVQDLKERGMLDDTLVIWGGEFGRTPFGQGDPVSPRGRDHFGRAFSWWMAGGGIKAGSVYGATDDFGWNITENPVHVHDMQATILHLCGIDHTRLTFRYQGRQYRLTDIHGDVVKGILA